MKHYLIASLIATICCSAADSQATTTPEREMVRGVDLKTGITFAQANAIASYYFENYIGDCGYPEPAVDRGSRWEVPLLIGVAATPSNRPIIIEKHTGHVSRHGGGPALNLASIIASPEATLPLPLPIHKVLVRWPTDLARKAHKTTIELQFVVLPSGATSDVRFRQAVEPLECLFAAREALLSWRYAPRTRPLRLIESIETCTY